MQNSRLKYSIYSQLGIFLLFLIIHPKALAFSITIGEPQINSILSLTFPYQTRMGNNHITLTDPKPHFYESSQEIGITLNILLKDQAGGQTAKARTMLRGGIHFDNEQQELQLVKPKIVRLDWVKKTDAANQDLARQIEQIVGQELPIIVLIDIKQLTGKSFTATLSDVKIKNKAIEISF